MNKIGNFLLLLIVTFAAYTWMGSICKENNCFENELHNQTLNQVLNNDSIFPNPERYEIEYNNELYSFGRVQNLANIATNSIIALHLEYVKLGFEAGYEDPSLSRSVITMAVIFSLLAFLPLIFYIIIVLGIIFYYIYLGVAKYLLSKDHSIILKRR